MFWLEPMVEVATARGRVAYGPVAAADVASLFDSDFLDGGDHRLGLGLTEEIAYLKRQERLTFARVGMIDPVSLDDYVAHGGYRGLERALSMPGAKRSSRRSPNRVCAGAAARAFPRASNGRPRSRPPRRQKYVVCNADEGDSGTFSDRMIMEGDPFVLIEGMTIAALCVGATQGYIYLRSEYPHALRTLNEAIGAAYSAATWARTSPAAATVRSGSSARRRRVHLRRGNRDAREPRGQARDGALQAAGARDRRAVRPADDRQQRRLARDGADHPRARRRILQGLRRWAARAARYRFNSPATSSVRDWSRKPSASRCANSSRTTAAAPASGTSAARGAGRRPARRLFSREHARPADGLRGVRRAKRNRSATAESWSSTTRSTWRAWRATRWSSARSNRAANARRAESDRLAAPKSSIGSS